MGFRRCKKKFLTGLRWESVSVYYPDEISDRQFILDFAKVVDSYKEMKG
jgi:hypothetical protein